MSKKSVYQIIISIIFLGIIWLLPNKVKANTLLISSSNAILTSGQTTTITVSSDSIGRVNLSVSGNATINSDRVWVEGNSQSVTLTATGTGKITVTATPENPMSLNGTKVNLSAASCSIDVKETSSNGNSNSSSPNDNSNGGNSGNSNSQTRAPATPTTTPKKSSVATLSNLGITPNDFKGFTPSKTSYSVTVPNSVSSVSIYANKGQSGQTISGTGTKKLQEGANQFSVVVTAEDGKTTKTYTLAVTREKATNTNNETNTTDNNVTDENMLPEDEKTDDNTNSEESVEQKIGLSKLYITGIDLSPNFQKDIYEYTAKIIGDETMLDIDVGTIETTNKVEIVGNENLKEGENIITILVSDENGENTVTYQITVDKSLVNEEIISKEKAKEMQQKEQRTRIIVGMVIAIVVIAIILIIRFIRNRREVEDYSGMYLSQDNQNLYEEEKLEEQANDFVDNVYEEQPKRNKRSKGKRFK